MIRFTSILAMALLLVHIPFMAQAGSMGIVLSESYENLVAVRYKTRADYIAQTVRITSKEKDFKAKLSSLYNAKKYLLEQAGKERQIVVHERPAQLSPGTKFLSKTSYGVEPQMEIQLLLPIVSDSDNIFSGGIELAGLLDKFDPPEKIRFHPSAVRLAVEDPEKLRGKILEMISNEMKATKETMRATGRITISGLEGPVKVNQVDDINVELFIEYKMSLETQ